MLFVDPNTTPKKSSPPIHLDVETRVRNWTVTRVLEPTAGGMQEAVAEDAQGTPVLLRVPGDTDAIERVFAEAALAKRHRHWGIVHTIGVVDHQGWPVQVVEHVDGLSLDQVSLLAGSLAPEAVCRIGWQIAVILAELHREPGGHHGALSGERILVDAAGHIRLADLGRARPEQLFRLLSPERRASGGVGSPEDDLYALGGTLIEAALGRPLERTIGWIDTRALGGVLPERLIDALEALVAPSGKRLKNASAVMRVFETLEPMLGDGSMRLKKAVEYARLGAAIGSAASKERPDVDDARTLPPSKSKATHASPFEPFDETPDELALTDPGAPAPVAPFVPFSDRSSPAAVALESAPSAEAMPLAAIAPIAADAAPDEVTSPSDPALDARAQSFYARQSAEPVTETQVEVPPAVAPRAASAPIASSVDDDEIAPPKKKWPLFSRMIAWGFVGLLAVNVLATVWVLAEPPLSQAFGTQLPKLPGSDMTLDSMAQAALGSLVAGATDPSFALPLDEAALGGAALGGAALGGAAPDVALADAPPAPSELALSDKEQQEFAAALAALAAELEKAQPGLAASAPALDEPAGGALALDEPAPVAAASYDGRPIGMPKRKAAKKPGAAVAPAAPAQEPPAKLAKPEKPAKVEKVAKAERPDKSAKPEKPSKADKPSKGDATEASAPGVPVKLIVEASAAMRAQAEAGLRNCNLKAPVNGVVRVSPAGTVRSVSTDPLNPCVAKVLKQTLGGFEEDAPFEVNPR